MTTPVTLVTGFLGAGKTTFINRLLQEADGLRLAAIVNDFGAINIDASLIAASSDAVIGLKNGCICCSLQGDLLRTLRQVALNDPPPDAIVIEASGVADPRGIVETLMDSVFLQAVRLDAIIGVVDIEWLESDPRLRDDPLWQAQLAASDFVALAKADGCAVSARAERDRLLSSGKALVFDAASPPPLATLLRDPPRRPAVACVAALPADRFATLEWTRPGSVPPDQFRRVVQDLAPHLVRAKGVLNFTGDDTRSFVFHLVGRRASIEPLNNRQATSELVLIGEATAFDVQRARSLLLEALGCPEGREK